MHEKGRFNGYSMQMNTITIHLGHLSLPGRSFQQENLVNHFFSFLQRPLLKAFLSRGKSLNPFKNTVNNKKTHTLHFSRIFPKPLELQKICFHFFAPFSEELSVGTRIFQIRLQNQLIFAKTLICQ